MARLSLNLAVPLALVLLSVLPNTLAARPGFRPEEPPEIPDEPVPGANVQANPADSPHGAGAPFSASEPETETEDGEEIDFSELADKIKELLQDISDLFPSDSTTPTIPTTTANTTESNTNAAPSSATAFTTSPGTLNATLGCEIYQSYTALCPNATKAPYAPILGPLTETADVSGASVLAASSRASCLCYSSFYYVPEAYDDAAWACGGYTTVTSPNSALAAAATEAAETSGFCSSIGNVRTGASTATFGQFTTTPTPSVTPTSMPTTSTGGTTSTGAAVRLPGGVREVWALAVVVVVALV